MDMRYERPSSVAQACALLAETHARAVVLAGGTDLAIKLRSRELVPELVVDIKGIAELSATRLSPEGELFIGAAVTMRQIYEDARVVEQYPGLTAGAEAVGSLQVRSRATVVGNLCNASPCMDTAPALLLLGAMLRVAGPKGERDLPLESFFLGVKRTQLAPGELCTAVIVPAASRRWLTAFDKIKRVRGHDLALVNAAGAYDPATATLRACIGSCGVTPVLTKLLVGIKPGSDAEAAGNQLAQAALEVVKPIDDVRASAEYRRDMAALLCRRLGRQLLARRAGR